MTAGVLLAGPSVATILVSREMGMAFRELLSEGVQEGIPQPPWVACSLGGNQEGA